MNFGHRVLCVKNRRQKCMKSTRCRNCKRKKTYSGSSDRPFKISPGMPEKQRLAEAFETALRHADGRALAVEMDSGHEHLFSAKFSCPVCSYSLPELEPRLFSFNNPMGACPKCDGLGKITFLDPKRIVAFPHLSLASGAIKGWDRRNQFYFQLLAGLASTTILTWNSL